MLNETVARGTFNPSRYFDKLYTSDRNNPCCVMTGISQCWQCLLFCVLCVDQYMDLNEWEKSWNIYPAGISLAAKYCTQGKKTLCRWGKNPVLFFWTFVKRRGSKIFIISPCSLPETSLSYFASKNAVKVVTIIINLCLFLQMLFLLLLSCLSVEWSLPTISIASSGTFPRHCGRVCCVFIHFYNDVLPGGIIGFLPSHYHLIIIYFTIILIQFY